MPNLQNGSKGGFERVKGSLDYEPGVLPLSYRGPLDGLQPEIAIYLKKKCSYPKKITITSKTIQLHIFRGLSTNVAHTCTPLQKMHSHVP